MGTNKIVLGLVGSPNRTGRTQQLVKATLDGVRRAGGGTELIQMADHVVAACKDCLPWVCQTKQKCIFEDKVFEFLSQKMLECGALVLGSPVYWWDTSGLMRYFFLKMFRVFAHSAPFKGLPALGIAIAGGTGNGLISGLRPLYHFFQIMQMRGIEPLPATRFNFESALQRAGEFGQKIAGMVQERQPFSGVEERLLWYDALPYLGLSRAAERRLLADLSTIALPSTADPQLANGLVQADALKASGRLLESLTEVTRVYDAGVKAFDDQ